MAKKIMQCNVCKKYTMKEECCSEKTREPKPPKYSPEDKYAGYRRQVKEEQLKQGGFL